MSVQNPQLAGFLLTGNRSNFLYVEGSTAWLFDCPRFLSPLYKADRCFDSIPKHFRDNLMQIDPITRQTYDYATPLACDNNPRNIIELDPDSDDQQPFTFLDQNLLNGNHHFCFHLLKLKLQHDLILSQPKMLDYNLMPN